MTKNSSISKSTTLLTVGALLLVVCGCTGRPGSGGEQQPDSSIGTFSKSYGGPLHDEARVVLEADDGGFMLFGSVNGDDLNDDAMALPADRGSPRGGDLWMQKLDADGNFVLGRRMGGTALPPQTDWIRARPTSDGGEVLVGTRAIRHEVTLPGADSVSVKVGRDMAVAKLGPDHSVVWSVNFDSGPWPGFDYVAENGELAEAEDKAFDVWPMQEGGYLVAGVSKAHLDDRGAGGFPRCHDEEINELVIGSRGSHIADECREPVDDTFKEAFSIVVLRLNTDGTLRWQRRITDNAFGLSHSNEDYQLGPLGPLIRGTHDGGAILVRGLGGGSVAYRLETNGEVRWRAALPGLYLPSGVFQTDDPVDSGLRDAVRDDGFVISGMEKRPDGGAGVYKLSSAGEVEWESAHEDIRLHDVAQRCDYGGPVVCHVIAVGYENNVDPSQGRELVMVLEEDGSVRDEVHGPSGGGPVTRILITPDNEVHLLGFYRGFARREQLQVFSERFEYSLELARYSEELGARGWGDGTDHPTLVAPPSEISDDRRVLQLMGRGSLLQVLFEEAPPVPLGVLSVQVEVPLAEVTDNDRLQAAVRIGAGRYMLAGSRVAGPRASSSIVVARYDSDLNGDRVIWQRDLAGGVQGSVLAAAPSADGGAVLSVKLAGVGEQPEGEADVGRLIKLDALGNVQWQLALQSRVADELLLMPDGGFAALTGIAGDPQSQAWVLRVSSAGEVLWSHSITTVRELRPTAMSLGANGGLVLAASAPSALDIVHLAADGSLVSAGEVMLGTLTAGADFDASRMVLSPADATFEDVRIRQTADGGFVLAMTEADMIAFLPREGVNTPPAGQTNVLVLKVDASFRPLWAHLYGAHLDERVRDLLVRADGTIAIAGYSDSLGERREAWLLKLSSEGLITGGCQAMLHAFRVDPSATYALPTTVSPGSLPTHAPTMSLPSSDIALPSGATRDLVTARQCSGTGGGAVETWRLTLQTEGRRGAITSTPAGISCGTQVDVCAADFPRGSLVTLQAEPERFVAWRSTCEGDSGGTQLRCVVLLNSDRTVQVEFRPESPPPRGQFTLSFEIRGPGAVLAGDINCREDSQPEGCSLPFSDGALVSIAAFPTRDWFGTGEDASFVGWSGDPACSVLGNQRSGLITVDHDIHCVAEFREPNVHFLRFSVTGGGIVTGSPGFDCREGMMGGGCQGRYPETTTVPLQAVADFGQVFAGWGGDCASFGTAPNIEVVVANNMICTARFEQGTTPVTLTVSTLNGAPNRIVDSLVCAGSVCSPAGIHCFDGPGADCSEAYLPGTEVILRPNLAGVDWGGCDSVFRDVSGIADCRVRMDRTGRGATAIFPPF